MGLFFLMIYILIEHQSEPDRLMPLRTVDYVVQIYKYQVREWSKNHRSLARIRLYPDQQQPAAAIKDLSSGHGPVRVQITLPDGTIDQIAVDRGAEVTRQTPGGAAEPWASLK
jgi:hypothetical protein